MDYASSLVDYKLEDKEKTYQKFGSMLVKEFGSRQIIVLVTVGGTRPRIHYASAGMVRKGYSPNEVWRRATNAAHSVDGVEQ